MTAVVPAQGNLFGKLIPARYVFAILGSMGLAIIYGVRDNFAIMPYYRSYLREYHMYSILGSIASQIPAAFIAHKFSAKWVMFFAVALNVWCVLLLSMTSDLGYEFLFLLRTLEGIGLGASFPAMHTMIAAWSPPNQRTVISTIIYVSMLYGGHVSVYLTTLLSNEWIKEHYILGCLCCIWLLLWIILIQDNPNKQRYISEAEREMITTSLSTSVKASHAHTPIPWASIFSSAPFWGILFAHSFYNGGLHLFRKAMVFELYKSHLSIELCYFIALILCISLAIILDALRAKKKISTTVARKIAAGIATVLPFVCAIILCIPHEDSASNILLAIGLVSICGHFPGILSNHIDIAPNYAGMLGAITNTVATLPSLYLARYTQAAEKESNDWHFLNNIAIACFFGGFVVFLAFGSGKEQRWNKTTHANVIEVETVKVASVYPELK